ncbi:MAG: transposase [Anaerolineales bacterium]|nr:MAG: transposase [Anaerolineales bacterium]
MPKPVPLQYGKYYHIFNRGNSQENIFIEERNYCYFLKLYARHIMPVADTYAYCLLRNHFHFLVRIKTVEEPDLTGFGNLSGLPRKPSQPFSNLFNAYAKAFNKTYHRTGTLFQRPFGRIEVTSDSYFMQLVTYIHQNPQKHGFVSDFRTWPYSSYQALLSTKPTRLQRDDVLAWFQGVDHFEDVHRYEVDERKIAPLVPDDFD